MRFDKEISIEELAQFEPDADALVSYGIAPLIAENWEEEELWSVRPEGQPSVHRGNIQVEGATVCHMQGGDAFIIDGDLIVNGPLVLYDSDFCTLVVVTGDLKCTHLVVGRDCLVYVQGKTTVQDLCILDTSDAGEVRFLGDYSATHTVVGDTCSVFFKHPPDPENVSGDDYFTSDEETLVAKGAEPVFSDEMNAELELEKGELPDLDDLGAALIRGIPLQ